MLTQGSLAVCVLALVLAVPIGAGADANGNGNGAGLYLSTSDYWSGESDTNPLNADVIYAGTPDVGEQSTNTLAAGLTLNPLDSRNGRGQDFGDAPAPYPTLSADTGAYHLLSDVFLGTVVDAEGDGQPSAAADGDDTDAEGDDEDGVTFTSTLELNQTVTLDVVASAPGYLNAWLDFNADGDWADGVQADVGEQIFTDEALVAGTNTLSFIVSITGKRGDTFARFRFSTAEGSSYTGVAADGEVEDHGVTLVGMPSSTTVTASANPTTYADSVTFTATVAGAHTTPTGTVEFFNGATSLGTETLSGGSASVTTSTLVTSAHTITATYSGDDTYRPGTSAGLPHTVNKAATATAASANTALAQVGETVTVTTTVSSGAGTPTGQVRFTATGQIDVTKPLAAGQATQTYTWAAGGAKIITVEYLGDTNFLGSTSAPVGVIVNTWPTTVNDTPTVVEDSTDNIIDVLGNDADPDGDPLIVASVGAPNQGGSASVTPGGGSVTYTPKADFDGAETFTYTVSDGKGGVSSASVTVTVTPVNDAPMITAQAPCSTKAETALTISLNDFTVDDPDNTYPTDFTLAVQNGANYVRTGNTITAVRDFTGTLAVPVTVNDGAADSPVFSACVEVTDRDEPSTCDAMSMMLGQWVLFSADFGVTTDDMDGDGLPDMYAVALVQWVACTGPEDVLWAATENAYAINLLALDAEPQAAALAPYRELLAVLMLTSQDVQDSVVAVLAGQGIALVGTYEVVQTDGLGNYTPKAIPDVPIKENYEVFLGDAKTLAEPFSGTGNLDLDAASNLTEYLNTSQRNGNILDFVLVATDPTRDGTEILLPGDDDPGLGACNPLAGGTRGGPGGPNGNVLLAGILLLALLLIAPRATKISWARNEEKYEG